MNVGLSSPSFANAISPFNPVGKQAVGEENTETKNSTLKSIENAPESARNENRTKEKDAEQKAVDDQQYKVKAKGDDDSSTSDEDKAKARKHAQEKQEALQDQEKIRELSTRDREVRAHEQAHAAVGGQHAGSPQYDFKRGPDGVSYAVSGEVAISTSKVPNDPEATISKAQQVRRAALAPAEPSPQDRRVAATASQMEIDARKDLLELRQQEAQFEREQAAAERASRQQEEEGRETAYQETQQENRARTTAFKEQRDLQRNFQQRLIDIGVAPSRGEIGAVIRESV